MPIKSEGNTISLTAVIYEDEVLELRDQLNKLAPDALVFDLRDCDDVHLAVIQQMLAYKKMYSCTFEFPVTPKLYQKVIEGFDMGECEI